VGFCRVKLYDLEPDGKWNDRGTGRLTYAQETLKVKSEADSAEVLLEYPVADEVFKRQGETIIIWEDDDGSTHALSFQDSAGSNLVWRQICEKKGIDPTLVPEDSDVEDDEDIPIQTLENLEDFYTVLSELTIDRKEKFANLVLSGGYLENLGDLLRDAEEKEHTSKLPLFFFIFKELVHLNHLSLLELMLSDEHYLTLFGSLEHDPDLNGKQFNSKEFLTKTLKFKNVLEINNKEFLKKIHVAYRLQYLKDTVLARCLDEATIGHLTSFNLFLWNDLVAAYTKNSDIRSRLILKLETGHYEAFCFLHELVSMAKNVTSSSRMYFYDIICDDGILELLAAGLESREFTPEQHNKLRVVTSDLVISLLQVTPHLIKRHFLSAKEKERNFPFLKHICAAMLESEDISVQQQMSELLRILLSPEEHEHLYELCDVFYDQIMHSFIEKLHVNAVNLEETRLCLCEILCIMTQCVQTHTARMRYFLLYNDVLQRTIKLFELNDKTIMLAVLKFFRAVAGHKDRFLQEYLVANQFFKPIMETFKENGEKENMIFHSVLALLEVIRNSQADLLLECIVTKHIPTFKDTPLEKYFEGIKSAHEELQQRNQKLAGWLSKEISSKEDEDFFADDSEHFLSPSQDSRKRKLSSDSDDNPCKKLKLT